MARVTENSSLNTIRQSLSHVRHKLNKLQKQNATLKRVNRPSDDPVGNVTLMNIRNTRLSNEQFGSNGSMAKTFLNYTDTVLDEMTEMLSRAKELTIQASNSAASGPDSRVMIAQEIRSIQDQMLSIGNRKLGNRYLFGGYQTDTQPFDIDGRYYGDNGEMMLEVEKDVFVAMNLPGDELFLGSKRSRVDPTIEGQVKADGRGQEGKVPQQGFLAGGDVFRVLESLRNGLMTNNTELIQASLEPLSDIRTRVIETRAKVGSRMTGIERSGNSMEARLLYDAELQSEIEDVDVIKVVSDLAREETVLRSSLAASKKLLQPTLLDFLR